MDMERYCIYKITNNVNGKIYIGMTSKSIQSRFKEHIRLAKSNSKTSKETRKYIHSAIRKYGSENFVCEQIDEISGFENALNLEANYIEGLNSINNDIGYNLKIESYNGKCFTSASTRKKISIGHHSRKIGELVGIDQSNGNFVAYIDSDRKRYRKKFDTIELAVEGRDKMALYLYGDNAFLNCPTKKEQYLQDDLKKIFNLFNEKKICKTSGVGYLNDDLFSSYAVDVKDKTKRILCGVYKTEKEAAMARDKVYLEITNFNKKYFKFLNYKSEILSIPLSQIRRDAEFLLKNGKKIHPYKTEYSGVEKQENGKFSCLIHSSFGWRDIICENIKNKERAAILHDKINFLMGNNECINFPEKIKEYDRKKIRILYRKLTGRTARDIESNGICFYEKCKNYNFVIRGDKITRCGGFATPDLALRVKDLYMIFLYNKPEEVRNQDIFLEDKVLLRAEFEKRYEEQQKKNKMARRRSAYFGVKKTKYETWASVVYIDQKAVSLSFGSEIEAAINYDKRHYAEYGDIKKINFPQKIIDPSALLGGDLDEIYNKPTKLPIEIKIKTSKYNGVMKRSARTWVMRSTFNKKRNEEVFLNEEDAGRAHDYYLRLNNGNLALLNFPSENITDKPVNEEIRKKIRHHTNDNS